MTDPTTPRRRSDPRLPGPTEMPASLASPAGRLALHAARAGDGCLYRWPDCLWRARPSEGAPATAGEAWHGDVTVQRLVLQRRLVVVLRNARGAPYMVEVPAPNPETPESPKVSDNGN